MKNLSQITEKKRNNWVKRLQDESIKKIQAELKSKEPVLHYHFAVDLPAASYN